MSYLESFENSFKKKKEPERVHVPPALQAAQDRVNAFLQAWVAQEFPPGEGATVPAQIMFFVQLLIEQSGIKKVLEIGMNQGLSTGCLLAARPDIHVVSIDIGTHDYILKAQKFISSYFPGRHTLILGDSTDVMPQMGKMFTSYMPDLIFMDGGHTEPTVSQDITNCLNMCSPVTLLLIDDYHYKYPYQHEVRAAVDKAVSDKRMRMLGQWEGEQREWGLFKKLP